jgi:single-strand DNA-binding protein
MNYGSFAGRLGGDAEIRTTPSGKQVLAFSVGVTTGFGQNKSTLWVSCSMWGDRGTKLQQYLTKGLPVAVAGEVSLRTYKDKQGEARGSMELNVQSVTMLGTAQERGGERTPAERSNAHEDPNDEIPF